MEQGFRHIPIEGNHMEITDLASTPVYSPIGLAGTHRRASGGDCPTWIPVAPCFRTINEERMASART